MLGAPDLDSAGLHRILGDATAPKVVLGIKGAQMHLAPGVSQRIQMLPPVKNEDAVFSSSPNTLKCHGIKLIYIVQEKACNIRSDQTKIGNRRFQPAFCAVSRNLMKAEVQPKTRMQDIFT